MLEQDPGAIRSPDDPRDFDIRTALADVPVSTAPASWNVSPVPPILDQDGTGRCSGYSSARMIMYLNRLDPTVKRWVQIDPDGSYWAIKSIDGIRSEGSTGRWAMQAALKLGFPEKGSKRRWRIKAYYRVPADVNTMKQALIRYGTLVAAKPWYRSEFQAKKNGTLPTRPKGEKQIGGHLFCIDGWDAKRGWLCPSSWGRDYGSNGRFFLPFSRTSELWECWKAVDVEGI